MGSSWTHDGTRQTGVGLVEVLVTVVILSIGLLGLARLQLTSTQSANSAAQRFEATVLAQDILERMRLNRQQALAGAYDIDLYEAPSGGGIAGQDLAAWKGALTALPEGAGAVSIENDGRATITIEWADALASTSDGPSVGTVQLRSEL